MTVVLDDTTDNPPHCPHGPTLLFKEKSSNYRYYACSVSRDHDFCSFKISAHKWKRHSEWKSLQKNSKRHSDYQYLLDHPSIHGYCLDCSRVVIADHDPNVSAKHYLSKHKKCNVKSAESFAEPICNLLKPYQCNENLAQYHFSQQTLQFICKYLLQPFNFDRILCIGCPTIHQQLSPSSLLLDMDERLYQFYRKDRFVRFNMFNGHFFDDDGQESLCKFLSESSNNILIVIDPPFGGLIECLARTVHSLFIEKSLNTSIALFFPYFNEHWVRKAFESDNIRITDFIVTYNNHRKFGSNTSPVRLYTNLHLDDFTAIDPQQYRWCDECKRTVFRNNRHCNQCGECAARDAKKSIRHCDKCNRCVKINLSHCDQCKRCHSLNKHQTF